MSRKIQHLQHLEIFPTEKTFVRLTRLNPTQKDIECWVGHKDPHIGEHKFVVKSSSMSYAKRKAFEVLRSGRVWRAF